MITMRSEVSGIHDRISSVTTDQLEH